MSDEREIMTWDIFGTSSRALAQMVADDGYEPDMVLAIARGGLLIGGAIGYALSVKNVYTMNVEFYTGVDERLEVPRILPPAPDFVDVSHAKILIAPREVDPQIGLLPDVVALDDRVRLLVEDPGAHVGHLALDELLHRPQRVARVGDVVDDEDLGV